MAMREHLDVYWAKSIHIQGMPSDPTASKLHRMPHSFRAFILSSLISTARLCASKPSHLANSMTAPPTFFSPSCVRFELVMCFVKLPRFTPEYCRAYPYVGKEWLTPAE